jgi:hypothetical protein
MFLFMYIIVVNMSCNSCNKKKKKQIIEQPIIEKSITDYMKEIYDIYDDNNFTFTDFELMADNLSNQPNNSEVSLLDYEDNENADTIINYIDDFNESIKKNHPTISTNKRYNLPRNIIYNTNTVYGNEVRKYINFTKLENSCQICSEIEQDINREATDYYIQDDSPCYNSINDVSQGMDCSEKETNNIIQIYWINGIRKRIINPELLIPNIFRRCQFNNFSCPTILTNIQINCNKNILSNVTTETFNRPKLIDGDIIKALLYKGVVTNSKSVSNKKYNKDHSINSKDLCFILSLLNFNYCGALNWSVLNIMRYYNDSLLFQLIDFINVCFKADTYNTIGKSACNYIVPWTATVACVSNMDGNDEGCLTSIFYTEKPITFEQQKIIYRTTILSSNIIHYLNNKIDYNNEQNNRLSIVLYYALEVFRDILLEMKYNISPYNSIQLTKVYCKKDYMLINPSKDTYKDSLMYKQICAYVCGLKFNCIPNNPKFFRYICIEINELNDYKGFAQGYAPSVENTYTNIRTKGGNNNGNLYFRKLLYRVPVDDGETGCKGTTTNFNKLGVCTTPTSDYININVIGQTSFYYLSDCGFGPFELSKDGYQLDASIIPAVRPEYTILYAFWQRMDNINYNNCKSCSCNGCGYDNVEWPSTIPIEDTTLVNSGIGLNDQYPISSNIHSSLPITIKPMDTNYCLRIFTLRYIQDLYVENNYNGKAEYTSFDFSRWATYYDYYTSKTTTETNYAETFLAKPANSLVKKDDDEIICNGLDNFIVQNHRILAYLNLLPKAGYQKNIMGFGIYSEYNQAVSTSENSYKLYFSQFYNKNKADSPQVNLDNKIDILGCTFDLKGEIVPSGQLLQGSDCSNFPYDYIKDKLYYINVLTYLPMYTFLPLSQANDYICENETNMSALIKANKHPDNDHSSTYSIKINPDIYMIKKYYNPNQWFFLDPLKGTLYTDYNNSTGEIIYDYDYLWYPPLDIHFSNASSSTAIDLNKYYNNIKSIMIKPITLSKGNVYYEKGENDNILNELLLPTIDKYFTIDQPIAIKSYQFVFNRTKSDSMTYLLYKGGLSGKKIYTNPFKIESNMNKGDPSKDFKINTSKVVDTRSLNPSSDSANEKSGIYFNTMVDNVYNTNNAISLTSNNSFTINEVLYYKANNIKLYQNDTSTKGVPQYYSNMTLPYKFQVNYYNNLQESFMNKTDINFDDDISCIPAKYNYAIPTYKPRESFSIPLDYYKVRLPTDQIGQIGHGIDILQVAPGKGSIYESGNIIKAFTNMNVLYSIKSYKTNPLNDNLINKLYAWGQYSETQDDNSFKESNNPHFRYSLDGDYKELENQFKNFKNNSYHLEFDGQLDKNLLTGGISASFFTGKYPKGHYVSVIPGAPKGLMKENNIKSALVLYPVVGITPIISDYTNTIDSPTFVIDEYKASPKGYYFSFKGIQPTISDHYQRNLDITGTAGYNQVKGLKYTYLNNSIKSGLFGIYYYDPLNDNYFPYDKGTDYNFSLFGNINVKSNTSNCDKGLIYPTNPYRSKGPYNDYLFEPIIQKGIGGGDYYFNTSTSLSTSANYKSNNDTTYHFQSLNDTETAKAISNPIKSMLHYNYVTFFNLDKANKIGKGGDISSFEISQQISSPNAMTAKASVDNIDTYFGIIAKADYTINFDVENSAYPNVSLTLYEAKGPCWQQHQTNKGSSMTIPNVHYDSYTQIKLEGSPIDIYTNYYPDDYTTYKSYPIIFSSKSDSNDILNTFSICDSFSDKTTSTWPLYLINYKGSCPCITSARTDIPNYFELNIGASEQNTFYKDHSCFLKPSSSQTKNMKADTIGMTYFIDKNTKGFIKSSSSSQSLSMYDYGLYDRQYCITSSCQNVTPLNFSLVTVTRESSTVYMQWDTKKDDLYTKLIEISFEDYNTVGLKMSMSNNLLIAGTPYEKLTYYNNNGITHKYSNTKGIIQIYDLSSNLLDQDANDYLMLEIHNTNLLECVAHYSIYGITAQNYILFSTDSPISDKGINPIDSSTHKGSTIYQFIEDGGYIVPFMSPPVDTKKQLPLQDNYYNGYSMDFIESNSDIFNLYSIIGNIPYCDKGGHSTGKGSIYFVENQYNLKKSISALSLISPPYYINDFGVESYTLDQFGSKVKTIYVDSTTNDAYIMAINRISYAIDKPDNVYSHAFLLKTNLNDEKIDDVKSMGHIELLNYQIVDASATISDGSSLNSRITFYLSVSPIKSLNNYQLNYNIFNATYKGADAPPSKILQFEFNNIPGKGYTLNTYSKRYSGFADTSQQPYDCNPMHSSFTLATSRDCYLFGGSLDVVNGQINIPYKGSNKLYRTNFLLANKKYQSIDGFPEPNTGGCSPPTNMSNIYSTATIYCDRIIEELTHKADYFDKNDFSTFYNEIYKGNKNALTNIELFTYPYYKGSNKNITKANENLVSSFNSQTSMWNYCSKVIYSKDLDNVEVTNDCLYQLPAYMAVADNYIHAIKADGIPSSSNIKGSVITIYKNNFTY